MTISPGHRFEATQALRQVLARAVVWGMIDVNPAKQRSREPSTPAHRETPIRIVASARGARSPARAALRADRDLRSRDRATARSAATGLRPGEWIALEQRDIDRDARVVYVRRALRNGRLKSTKTDGSIRAVPLHSIALAALDQLQADLGSELLFPSPRGGYFDLHNFRNRY